MTSPPNKLIPKIFYCNKAMLQGSIKTIDPTVKEMSFPRTFPRQNDYFPGQSI